MNQRIYVVGSNDANCHRIKDTLRRRFRNAHVYVNDSLPAHNENDIVIFADNPGSERQILDLGSESPVPVNQVKADLEERTRRAEFLFETTRILSSSQSLPEMLDQVVARSKEVLGETAFLVMLEPTPRLQSVASSNHDQVLQLLTFIINSRPTDLNALLEKVLISPQPLYIPDLRLDGDLPHSITLAARQLQLGAVVVSIIKTDHRNFGLFISASSKPNAFTESQLALSQEFSRALGSAIENVEIIRQLEERANTDSLTGLYNTRFFSEAILREIARAERHQAPLSLLLIDIDDFKGINDNQGHLAGNQVLKGIAQIFQRAVRITDIVVRIGGDEFGVLLPGTDVAGARHVAENIRSRIEASDELSGKALSQAVTVSIGVAEYVPGSGAEAWQIRADQALYRAKELSKNRVEVCESGSLKHGT
jgi:diguanylate cyclase (GGDEF)-like protein